MSALAVRCGTLIDGTGADPRQNVTLLVEDGAIVSIGDEAPRGATVLDASDLVVMPGLIDCHVHLWMQPESIQDRLMVPLSLNVARALENARVTLESGFTTVRDAGGTPRGVKMAIDQGRFPGPRVRIAVGALSQTGGHGDQLMPSGVDVRPRSPEHPVAIADGIEGVRRATRELLRAGADQIKVMTSGGVLSPSDEPTATAFSPEEIAAIVYEAHAAGKTLMSHAQATDGIRNAVLGGIESIEHGIYLEEDIAREMKRRGAFLVATLVAPQWVLRRAERDPASVPPYAKRKAAEVIEAHRRSFRMAAELGVPIAMGTDTGVGPHGTNAEELALMVENGTSPMQAIVATTKTAAECVRLGHLVGTLEPGKRADLIVVRGDPLADIGVLRDRERILLVVKDGTVHKRAGAFAAA